MKSCTYLGLEEDRDTVAGFPSIRNRCHRPAPPCAVAQDHQRDYCLSAEYVSCAAFNQPPTAGLPAIWSANNKMPYLTQPRRRRSTWLWILITCLLVLAIILLSPLVGLPVLAPSLGQFFPATLAPLPSHTPPAPFLPPPVPTAPPTLPAASPTPTASPAPTQTPSPTFTPGPTVVPGFALETPALQNPRLMLHKVRPGEGFTMLAAFYNIAEAAIRQINTYPSGPLWLDSVVVVPLDDINLDSLPVFQIYQVAQDDLTLAALAEQRNLSLDLLCQFNQAQPGTLLPAGRWLLLPLGPP